MFDNLTSISPHVRSGKVRGIGVSSLKRSPMFPDIPTIAEAGVPGYETNAWGGIVVPVGHFARDREETQRRNQQGVASRRL